MLWLVVPLVSIASALVALAAVRSLEAARRDLQRQVAALADGRDDLAQVQQRVAAVRVAAVARDRR